MGARLRGVWAAAFGVGVMGAPVVAHHSFAIFDGSRTLVYTGVVVRVNPDANHLQIFFAPMNEERTNVERDGAGDPVIWAVEMAGSAQAAQEGVSVNSFPAGTVFSVGLHPLRSGEPAGDRGESALVKCPGRTPPEPGLHCDSVEGHEVLGTGALPAALEAAPEGAPETAPEGTPEGTPEGIPEGIPEAPAAAEPATSEG